MSIELTSAQQADVETIERGRWPHWPLLPVKRHKKTGNQLGVIIDDELIRVYHVNLFDAPRTYEAFSKIPYTEYPSVETLVADGWVVD